MRDQLKSYLQSLELVILNNIYKIDPNVEIVTLKIYHFP